jgi:hypothetical protein
MFEFSNITKAPEMLQLGALSLLGWIVWYLLVKAFPAHVKSQAEERAAFLEAQEAARDDFKESIRELTHTIELIVTNCQTRAK